MSAVSGPIGRATHAASHQRFDVMSAGIALSLFFLITYALVVVAYLVDPGMAMTQALIHDFIPGTARPTAAQLVLGAVFAIAWGWYIAIVGVPLYNRFLARHPRTEA